MILVFWFFITKSREVEAPTVVDGSINETNVENNEPVVSGNTDTSVKEFTISGQNFSFTPSLIKVKRGDKVKITFYNTAGFHDFNLEGYGLATRKTEAPSQEILEFTADKVGKFEYYCSVGTHRTMGMTGILMVE